MRPARAARGLPRRPPRRRRRRSHAGSACASHPYASLLVSGHPLRLVRRVPAAATPHAEGTRRRLAAYIRRMRELTRKELLAGAAAAGVVAGCGSSAKKPPAFDPRDWASVKAQYGLSRDVRHFDAFVLSSHPRPVREAIERHRRELDADPARYVRENEAALGGRVAEAAAGYLGVSGGDLAFTDSTTM